MNLSTGKDQQISKERNEYIDEVLNMRALAPLIPIMETGYHAYDAHMKLNNSYYNEEEYLSVLKRRELSYGIYRQLKVQSKLANFPFAVHSEQINGYHERIPVLTIGDISITLLKVDKRYAVGKRIRGYLHKKSSGNNALNEQLSFIERDTVKDAHLHGILLYNMNKYTGEILFADIVFYNDNFKEFYHPIDLKEQYAVYNTALVQDDQEETLLNDNDIKKEVAENVAK